MASVRKISLQGRETVIAGPTPPTAEGFTSERIQVVHWQVDARHSDPAPHLHDASDEVYVVLEGSIDLVVGTTRMRVYAGEALAVGAGTPHAVLAVHYPARGLTIRGPAADDKRVLTDSVAVAGVPA